MGIRSARVLGRFSRVHMIALSVILAMVVLAVLVLPGTAAMAQDPQRDASQDERPTFEPPTADEAVPGEVIVKFEEGAGPNAKAKARRAEGLEKKKDLGLIGAELAKVKGGVGRGGHPRPRAPSRRRVRQPQQQAPREGLRRRAPF